MVQLRLLGALGTSVCSCAWSLRFGELANKGVPICLIGIGTALMREPGRLIYLTGSELGAGAHAIDTPIMSADAT